VSRSVPTADISPVDPSTSVFTSGMSRSHSCHFLPMYLFLWTVLDDESGEFMERAEVTGIGRSKPKMGRLVRFVGEKQGIASRDKVKRNEKTDQLFVKMRMKVMSVVRPILSSDLLLMLSAFCVS